MKSVLILFGLALIAGCDGSPEREALWKQREVATYVEPGKSGGRFTVSRQMVFYDDLAYGDKRAVYTIRDNQTGMEYVGVSGIGVSELGRHPAGKSTVSDER